MQGFLTESRSTSNGPQVFLDGHVRIGVGLSHVQFGEGRDNNFLYVPDGMLACGMCLNVTRAEGIPAFNEELTVWSDNTSSVFSDDDWFIAMVFDQCNDGVCESGYLDFDIYSFTQPWRPRALEWHVLDCPVTTGIEYLFCNPDDCNAQDEHKHFWHPDPWFMGMIIRNSRQPVLEVTLDDRPLVYHPGYGWVMEPVPYDRDFTLTLRSVLGEEITDVVSWVGIAHQPSTIGYNGGMLTRREVQFSGR